MNPENLAELRRTVEYANSMKRLLQNPDFNTVIMKLYLQDKALENVYLKGNTSVNQEVIEDNLKAIACLNNFILSVLNDGESANLMLNE